MKILTEGKVVPSEGVVQQFYRWPVDILSKIRKHVFFTIRAVKGTEDGQIGVHCTHGLNRTGYLVCRSLCSMSEDLTELLSAGT